MNKTNIVKSVIKNLWHTDNETSILSNKIDVHIYNNLSKTIPDKYIIIEEVFPEEELDDIFENYKDYILDFNILPLLGTLGEAVICIGYGADNLGNVYYFDFDFGCVYLDDDFESFNDKLLTM